MPASANELILTRTYAAPIALLWRAWTDPAHIARWWGPQGFGGDGCKVELRAGGAFDLILTAPDGVRYPCRGTFVEVVAEQRLVFDGEATEGHPCGAGLPPRARVTVTFTSQGEHTLLTHHTRFVDKACLTAASEAGYRQGWEDSLTRLADLCSTSLPLDIGSAI